MKRLSGEEYIQTQIDWKGTGKRFEARTCSS